MALSSLGSLLAPYCCFIDKVTQNNDVAHLMVLRCMLHWTHPAHHTPISLPTTHTCTLCLCSDGLTMALWMAGRACSGCSCPGVTTHALQIVASKWWQPQVQAYPFLGSQAPLSPRQVRIVCKACAIAPTDFDSKGALLSRMQVRAAHSMGGHRSRTESKCSAVVALRSDAPVMHRGRQARD